MLPSTLSLVLVCAVLGGMLLFAAVTYGRDVLVDLGEPLRTLDASVVARRREEVQGSGWSPATTFYVTFAQEDGTTVEFIVSEKEFDRLEEGQHGILRIKGGWYRGFRT